VRVLKKTRNIAAAIVLAALLISVASSASAAPPRRVVVVLAPYLNWTDIASMPNLHSLAATALLADMNVRAGGVMGGSTPDRGALVLSAGAPINTADGALSAYDATETVGITPARNLYLQYFGKQPGDADILFEGLPKQALANVDPSSSAAIGALGAAVHAAGGRTVAIGNADLGELVDPFHASRPAAEAATDLNGLIDSGDISAAMLTPDAGSPYGVRANVGGILATYRAAMAASGSELIVVDPGDLARAASIASSVTSSAADAMRTRALKSTDQIIGGIVAGAGPDDVVMVLAPAVAAVTDVSAGYGPLIVSENATTGVGTSGSTHRDGIVTEMDVSASIVEMLGGSVPNEMAGSRLHAGPTLAGSSADDRIAFLDQLNTTSVAVESVRMTLVNYFIILAVVVLLGATLILYRSHSGLPAWLPTGARIALLVPMAMLLGAVLQFVAWKWPNSGADVVSMLLLFTALTLAVALIPFRSKRETLPLIVLAGSTTLILLVDQWMGAPLSLTGIFGYSPLLGARYYGMGNEMAGLVLGSAVVAFALVLDTWPQAGWVKPMRVWGWPVLGIVLLATAAAPMWGANVGPAAWMTVGFLVGWLMLNGKKVLTVRNVAILLVLIVVVVAGLSALDLARGADSETHLGRAVTGAVSGGVGTLWTIIVRKADTNMRVLGRTNWTWMLVAVLLLLAYMRWRPRGEFGEMLKRYPAFSVVLAAALFSGVTAYFTEDSGIIIPALMFIPVGVTALYLMLLPFSPVKGDDE
jgi:hypothetical protein